MIEVTQSVGEACCLKTRQAREHYYLLQVNTHTLVSGYNISSHVNGISPPSSVTNWLPPSIALSLVNRVNAIENINMNILIIPLKYFSPPFYTDFPPLK